MKKTLHGQLSRDHTSVMYSFLGALAESKLRLAADVRRRIRTERAAEGKATDDDTLDRLAEQVRAMEEEDVCGGR